MEDKTHATHMIVVQKLSVSDDSLSASTSANLANLVAAAGVATAFVVGTKRFGGTSRKHCPANPTSLIASSRRALLLL